jgi:hypothetical protein
MHSSRGRLRNQVLNTLVWLWWVIDVLLFEFESEIFWWFYPIICSCGELCLLVSLCVGGRYNMTANNEDRGRSRRLGAEDWGWSSIGRVLGGRTIERSGDVVCGLHHAQEDEERGFLWFGPQNQHPWFSDLGHKITATVLGFGLKTKWVVVCRLCHKTDGRMKTVQDTHQDLAACFTWKRVGLRFPSLASRLAEARRKWWTWHHRGGHVEMKLKMDGSMRWATSHSSTPTLPFSLD